MAGKRRLRCNGGAAFPQGRPATTGRIVRALIVDNERLARRGVVLRLSKFKDVEIVGECSDGLSAVQKILELSPDVVFLDIQMPGFGSPSRSSSQEFA